MTSIDDKIKQALDDEFDEIIDDNNNYDFGIITRFESGFKGKLRKSYRTIYILIILSYIMCGILSYKFAVTDNTKMLIAYATGALFFVIMSMLGELWYFSEIGRNRVIREIKIVELQLAQVLENQEK